MAYLPLIKGIGIGFLKPQTIFDFHIKSRPSTDTLQHVDIARRRGHCYSIPLFHSNNPPMDHPARRHPPIFNAAVPPAGRNAPPGPPNLHTRVTMGTRFPIVCQWSLINRKLGAPKHYPSTPPPLRSAGAPLFFTNCELCKNKFFISRRSKPNEAKYARPVCTWSAMCNRYAPRCSYSHWIEKPVCVSGLLGVRGGGNYNKRSLSRRPPTMRIPI